MTLWQRWTWLWNFEERPTSLALVRIGIALVLLWDWGEMARLGIVEAVWAPDVVGGLSTALERTPIPEVYRLFPPTTATAWGLWGVLMGSALCFGLGFFTRPAAVVLLLTYAQAAQVMPLSDRGIDTMLRNVLLILIFSRCGDTLSLDAWRRTGRVRGDGALVPAWPRHLLLLQLVVMYWMAGVQKVALDWTPLGGYAALFVVLQDPHMARFDFSTLKQVYPLTQLATATTHIWEWTIPHMLYGVWVRGTPERTGALRRFYQRFHVYEISVVVGVLLHLGIALSMRLGIFPWAMLALYPAWFHPEVLERRFPALLAPRTV